MELVPPTQHHITSNILTKYGQYSDRQSQMFLPSQPQVGIPRPHFSHYLLAVGHSPDRTNSPQPRTANFPSSALGDARPPLCLPTYPAHSSCSPQSKMRTSDTHTQSPILAPTVLVHRLPSSPILLLPRPNLLTQQQGQIQHPNPQPLHLTAWYLNGACK